MADATAAGVQPQQLQQSTDKHPLVHTKGMLGACTCGKLEVVRV